MNCKKWWFKFICENTFFFFWSINVYFSFLLLLWGGGLGGGGVLILLVICLSLFLRDEVSMKIGPLSAEREIEG